MWLIAMTIWAQQWVWDDLGRLARLDDAPRTSLAASVCPDMCRFDRTAHGDTRYLRLIGDEAVIYESHSPGLVTRIWMTQGDGVSQPLDPDVDIRIVIDGTTVMQVPLPEFFAGVHPPFLQPLVGNRDNSSGGQFCYVPIPYQSCRISLINALDRRIWFQVNGRDRPEHQIPSFDGSEDYTQFAQTLADPPSDPWSNTGPWLAHHPSLAPGDSIQVAVQGPDTLNGLRLIDQANLRGLWITLTIDGVTAAEMPMQDFFGCRPGQQECVSTLLFGATDSQLYSYWPIPFRNAFSLTIDDRDQVLPGPTQLHFWSRLNGRAPHPLDGRFQALGFEDPATKPGQGLTTLDLEGRGVWVGQFLELTGPGPSFEMLEGDERVWVDRIPQPAQKGTGVEDFFNGGFYFRNQIGLPQPFARALHGLGYADNTPTPVAGMARIMLADRIGFAEHILERVEAGPTDNISMGGRAVNFLYLDPATQEPAVESARARAPGSCLRLTTWWDPVSDQSHAIDIDQNGTISSAEASSVTGWIEVRNLADLSGLDCYVNASGAVIAVTGSVSIDLSALQQLRELHIRQAPDLQTLVLPNGLAKLTLAGSSVLTAIPPLPDLEQLNLADAPMVDSVDLADFPALTQLAVTGAGLTSLSINGHDLAFLRLETCNQLSHVQLTDVDALRTLEVRSCANLLQLSLSQAANLSAVRIHDCANLSNLDLTSLPRLMSLDLDSLAMASLDLNHVDARIVDIDRVPLTAIGLPTSNSIQALTLHNTELAELDLASLDALEFVNLRRSPTSTMDVPPSLVGLIATENRLQDVRGLAGATSLMLLDMRHNWLGDLSGLVANNTLLNLPHHAVRVDDNRLTGSCAQLTLLQSRAQASGALFSFDWQGHPWRAWPTQSVLVLIEDPRFSVNCE